MAQEYAVVRATTPATIPAAHRGCGIHECFHATPSASYRGGALDDGRGGRRRGAGGEAPKGRGGGPISLGAAGCNGPRQSRGELEQPYHFRAPC
jgi:hypothetical protein